METEKKKSLTPTTTKGGRGKVNTQSAMHRKRGEKNACYLLRKKGEGAEQNRWKEGARGSAERRKKEKKGWPSANRRVQTQEPGVTTGKAEAAIARLNDGAEKGGNLKNSELLVGKGGKRKGSLLGFWIS